MSSRSLSIASKLRLLDSAIPILAASKGTQPVDFASLEHIIEMACQSR